MLKILTKNNILLIPYSSNNSDNWIDFFIKTITIYNINAYNIYIYNDGDYTKKVETINKYFPNAQVINNINNINTVIEYFSIIISEKQNIETIHLNKDNQKYYFYYQDLKEIKERDIKLNVFYSNEKNTETHFLKVKIKNVDNNSVLMIDKNDKRIIVDNNYQNCSEFYFYFNEQILEYIQKKLSFTINYDSIDSIELLDISNEVYYKENGIIKNENKYYKQIDDFIEEIDIKNFVQGIDHIKYTECGNLNDYQLKKNLELHFTILILSYNNSKYVKSNLLSALKQEYKNFDVIFINCCSTDNTAEIAFQIGKNYDNFYLFNNTRRCYQTENFVTGSSIAKNDSIIVSLDGDDFFYDYSVLKKLNNIYLSQRCLMTYGSYIEYPYRESQYIRDNKIDLIKKKKFRNEKCCVSHLRTWKRDLILNLNYDDILYKGELPKMAGDVSVLISMIEIAYDRTCFISDRLYIYNLTNNNSDHNTNIQLQEETANFFYKKTEYNVIDHSKFNINNIYKNRSGFNRDELVISQLINFLNKDKVSIDKNAFFDKNKILLNRNNTNTINYFFMASLFLSLIFKSKVCFIFSCIIQLIKYKRIISKKKLPNKSHLEKIHYKNVVLDGDYQLQYEINKNVKLFLNNIIIHNIKTFEINGKNHTKKYLQKNVDNEILYKYLEDIFYKNKIDFNKINFEYNIVKKNADINIIIPVQNRKENLTCLLEHLKSLDSEDKTVMITVIEMNKKDHSKLCYDFNVNYINIEIPIYKFNKSLCANFTYYLYEKQNINYKYILFQDIDCIFKKTFLKNIFLYDYQNKAIQPFHNKTVVNCNEEISKKIRSKEISINDINGNDLCNGMQLMKRGCPGGSIFIRKEIFEQIGGFDYYFFDEYGEEDAMFFEKILLFFDIEFVDNTENNMYHLWHKPTINRLHNGKPFYLVYRESLLYIFMMMSNEYKKKFVIFLKKKFKINI